MFIKVEVSLLSGNILTPPDELVPTMLTMGILIVLLNPEDSQSDSAVNEAFLQVLKIIHTFLNFHQFLDPWLIQIGNIQDRLLGILLSRFFVNCRSRKNLLKCRLCLFLKSRLFVGAVNSVYIFVNYRICAITSIALLWTFSWRNCHFQSRVIVVRHFKCRLAV